MLNGICVKFAARSLIFSGLLFSMAVAADTDAPIVGDDVVFAVRDGVAAVEAEHFAAQAMTETRAFHLTTADHSSGIEPDGDPQHLAGASGGAYLEILPDTRRTHADKLIGGTNFSPEPGKMAVLSYKLHFDKPGTYYVWVRAYSTGGEDNGLHVGLDGEWPESGQRLQWCEGKNTWRWESKQRTEKEHCGEPNKIFLEVKEPGLHTVHFSMREDGFEFDKWLITTDVAFARPEGVGPQSVVHAGKMPEPLPFVKSKPKYPAHWGAPPEIQTRDLVPLPGGFGQGSSTLAAWIQKNLDKDASNAGSETTLQMPAASFNLINSGYYLDKGKWAAIDPDKNRNAKTGLTFPFPTGIYHLTLKTVGENDGKSTYTVSVDDSHVGSFQCPLSEQQFQEGVKFHKTWKNIHVTEGAIINVTSEVSSEDGAEFSRARWAAVTFEPANETTQKAAKPFLKSSATSTNSAQENSLPRTSPTTAFSSLPLILPRQPDGKGDVELSGESKTWHKITLTVDALYAHEQDNQPNPFTDVLFGAHFTHTDGTRYTVPGYFAADGDAANSSAESGTKWRVHFAADRPGAWSYQTIGPIVFKDGALSETLKDQKSTFNRSGTINVAASDKTGRDLRAHGRLQYVGSRYLQFAGSKQYFLKAGADAPETLLGYADFDNTIAGKPEKVPLKTWTPHVADWRAGDPEWKDGKGKGLIGAINYLSGKGCNAFSFLTYNAGGDGDNVWPFVHRDDKLHYDCSKLDQWGIVFDHGTALGMYLHFKMQETENDDHRKGKKGGFVPECLDGGNLGVQRKLYCRELIARFGHNLALNWNLGEENTQSTEQQQDMINYISELDAYNHNIVLHTFPEDQDRVYGPLLGDKSKLTGLSLQNSAIKDTHVQTVKWVRASTEAGRAWVVAFDESGTAAHGQCPDLGYRGFDGKDKTGKMIYTEHEVRQQTLWGTLMAGGAGVEYYFGYQFAENDLICEDWRSRDRSWDYCRIALNFFRDNQIPIQDLQPADELVGNTENDNRRYCMAKSGELYLVYLPNGGDCQLDLSKQTGEYSVQWFNPREGGSLASGAVTELKAGGEVSIGKPPDANDWLALIRRK